ncbi:MAG: prolyl aminopeptidase, partial [Verrucomicrobia bacterium]|nr:prolyl aminopeptidase [Verrucomicrobiota bacterium]
RTKYPPIEPYQTGVLDVGGHQLYWEECGKPRGLPVIFLHGGPGSGIDPGNRSYFDPSVYRIILMDQRGCGKSKPFASLHENTTWHLVEDVERLKVHLKIDKWVVFGGSWGSTLSLAYAETYPKSVLALILRGIFLGRPKELRWFYQFGAHHIFPDEWAKFIDPIPVEEREDLMQAYYRRLTSSDPSIRKRAASTWSSWEGAALKLIFDQKQFLQFTEDAHADALARIECHYFVNRCFFKTDNWLIEQIGKIQQIPATIIQGRYDIVCPMEAAWELHQAWPSATLEIIKDAGHAASEPGITDALVRATDYFGQLCLPS